MLFLSSGGLKRYEKLVTKKENELTSNTSSQGKKSAVGVEGEPLCRHR